jgi:cytidylate kinase
VSAPSGPAGLVVALDGPGSSGKSSVGAAAALELGYRFCDTGLLYRAATWLAVRRGIAAADAEGLVALVPEIELAHDGDGRLWRVLVDGADVTSNVHGEEVDGLVSAVSSVPQLRAALLARQRAIASDRRVIMAGRDIGTVVLPDADLKIFIDASVEERARRRAEERGIDPDGPDGQEILAALRRRDELDSTRAVAPLRAAADARHVISDGNRFEDTVAAVVAIVRAAEAERGLTAEHEPASAASAASPSTAPSASAELPAPARPSHRVAPPHDQPIERHVTPLIRAVALVARLLTQAVTRVRFEGAIDQIPREGPVIFAANHISNADPVILGAWLVPRLGRRLHWLAKKEMFGWPIIGWMAAHGGMHPVDRSTADVEALRLARRILDEGHPLFVFPEGTRSPDGRLQEAKDGVSMLALRTGAPIVPIGIAGSDRVWPKGRKLPRPGGRVTVMVGRPIRLADELPDGGKGRTAKGAATRLLMTRIAELLPSRHRGVYGDSFE